MKDILDKILTLKPIIFLDRLAYEFKKDNLSAVGAQLSYFLFLSLFPFLIVLLNILSYTPLISQELIFNNIQFFPVEIKNIIGNFVNDLTLNSSQGLLSLAALAGLWSASAGVLRLIKAINNAYDYKETRSYFKLKALAFVFTIALILLILLVLVSFVFGELIGRKLFTYLGIESIFINLWNYIRFIISISYMILLFTMLYRYSPSVGNNRRRISFIHTLPGAIFTTLGLMFISSAFSFYVNNFGNYSTTYGSIAGVTILMIWLYVLGILIVLGGEINATLRSLNNTKYRFDKNKSVLGSLLTIF